MQRSTAKLGGRRSSNNDIKKSLQLRCVANAVAARVALFSRKWISEGCASDPVERAARATLCSLFSKRRGKGEGPDGVSVRLKAKFAAFTCWACCDPRAP